MSQSTVPFLPFVKPEIDEETIQGVADVLRSGWITTGPQNQKFEAALSEFCGGRPVRTFNSGTATHRDRACASPASARRRSHHHARLVGVDQQCDLSKSARRRCSSTSIRSPAISTSNLLEKAITPRTKAIMPVYLSGLPVDMDRLYAIARAHKLRVIEDAAQAFGSTWKGERIGKLGDIVSFSFHANKNLTSVEGGALVLNNEEEAILAQKYRLQGITRTGFDGMDCDLLGGKYNLTDVAARVGLGQMPHLERFIAQRKKLARAYFAGFEGGAAAKLGVGLPLADFENSNWHMFLITLPLDKLSIDRAGFMGALKERGIGSGVHYPAIHLFSLYRARGFKEGMFPHAERYGASTVTLPLFTLMNEGDVERVCRAVNEICEQYGK